MADCSPDFKSFNDRLSLSPSEKRRLRAARTALTTKISWFFDNHENCPKVKFLGQGSFSMGTIIRPVKGEYDIDIGVYLLGYSDYQSDWPKPETVSRWIVKALEGHTSYSPINKRTCIRIKYKPPIPGSEISYHVDFPIYCRYRNLFDVEYTRIGITGDVQWSQKSDPVGFTDWFIEKCQKNEKDKNQLVRLVKYMKAWKENVREGGKFPSGMALTVLLAQNFTPDARDDVSFRETIRKAYNQLYARVFVEPIEIFSPVVPGNDLLSRLPDNRKAEFKYRFEQLVDDAKLALEDPSKSMAAARWKVHFGDRF